MIAALAVMAGPVGTVEEYDYDFALRGGELYLGGYEMGGKGDVAVLGDRIVAVGEAPGRARRELDATGMVVSPGFIDLHTHSEMIFQLTRGVPMPGSVKANLNYITQGVTTVVTGNCGSGFTGADQIKKWFDRVNKMPFGSNVIHLFPHGQLRFMVMGEAQAERTDPKPTPSEMEKMKELLDAGLGAGAWGLSTGLEYDPGARADTEELVELNRVVAGHQGVYTSHTRHEGPDPDKMLASYGEAIEIGERAGTPVQISHIKCSGNVVHGMSGKVIELIEAARARGVRVFADQYPYPAGSTTLSYMVPVQYRDGNKVLDKYCTKEGRKLIYDEVAKIQAAEMPPEVAMVSLYPWRPWHQNKTVAQIAGDNDPVETAMDLACSPIGLGIYFTISEDDIKNFMKRDWVATGSDGSTFHTALRYAHPRFYGTFPRKIRKYVFDEKVITLAFALRSMTEVPAESFNIPERGKLEEGYYADVVVFDPDAIRDLATFEKPCRYSEGIEYLLVNGVLSIDQGKYTGRRGGKALKLGEK
jgi:N-acyl-D-aspartate/D-glutamate deacylase